MILFKEVFNLQVFLIHLCWDARGEIAMYYLNTRDYDQELGTISFILLQSSTTRIRLMFFTEIIVGYSSESKCVVELLEV